MNVLLEGLYLLIVNVICCTIHDAFPFTVKEIRAVVHITKGLSDVGYILGGLPEVWKCVGSPVILLMNGETWSHVQRHGSKGPH